MKFSIKDFFSECDQILYGKLYFYVVSFAATFVSFNHKIIYLNQWHHF